MKVVVCNLGCKVNKYECDCLMRAFAEKGHEVSDKLGYADLFVINTCAVTSEAERKSRQCVARCLRYNGDAKVVVMGCASQNDPKFFEKAAGVTFVTGVEGKQFAAEKFGEKLTSILPLPLVFTPPTRPLPQRTRAFVKVQDGCDNFCSYCLIPYLRGRSRSRAVEEIVREIGELAPHTGEIVLTGIDLSSFGKKEGGSLTGLLRALSGVEVRLRLGSLEASVIDEGFLSALKGLKNFCPQFHLSLQSGSSKVLKSMNRHYTGEEYEEKVRLIREFFPRAGITTDLICGFPTEDEEQFRLSLELLERVGFSRVHVFGYSPRKGTAAAKLFKPLPPEVVKERVARAEETARCLAEKYINSLKGERLSVLLEEEKEGYFVGWSGEYVRCYVRSGRQNEEINVAAKQPFKDGVLCE